MTSRIDYAIAAELMRTYVCDGIRDGGLFMWHSGAKGTPSHRQGVCNDCLTYDRSALFRDPDIVWTGISDIQNRGFVRTNFLAGMTPRFTLCSCQSHASNGLHQRHELELGRLQQPTVQRRSRNVHISPSGTLSHANERFQSLYGNDGYDVRFLYRSRSRLFNLDRDEIHDRYDVSGLCVSAADHDAGRARGGS